MARLAPIRVLSASDVGAPIMRKDGDPSKSSEVI